MMFSSSVLLSDPFEDFYRQPNNPCSQKEINQLQQISHYIEIFNAIPSIRASRYGEEHKTLKEKLRKLDPNVSPMEEIRTLVTDIKILNTEITSYERINTYAASLHSHFPTLDTIKERHEKSIQTLIDKLDQPGEMLHIAKNLYVQINLYIEEYLDEPIPPYLNKLISIKSHLEQKYGKKLESTPDEVRLYSWASASHTYSTWERTRQNLKESILKNAFEQLKQDEIELKDFNAGTSLAKKLSAKEKKIMKERLENNLSQSTAIYACKRQQFIHLFGESDPWLLCYPAKDIYLELPHTQQIAIYQEMQQIKSKYDFIYAEERAWRLHEKYSHIRSDDLALMSELLERIQDAISDLKLRLMPGTFKNLFFKSNEHPLSAYLIALQEKLDQEKNQIVISWMARLNNAVVHSHDHILKTVHDTFTTYFQHKPFLVNSRNLLQKIPLITDPSQPGYVELLATLTENCLEERSANVKNIDSSTYGRSYIQHYFKERLNKKAQIEDILSEPRLIESAFLEMTEPDTLELTNDDLIEKNDDDEALSLPAAMPFDSLAFFLEQLVVIKDIHSEEGQEYLSTILNICYSKNSNAENETIGRLAALITGKWLPNDDEKSILLTHLQSMVNDSSIEVSQIYENLISMYVLTHWKLNNTISGLERFFQRDIPQAAETWRQQYISYMNLSTATFDNLFNQTIRFDEGATLNLTETITHSDVINFIRLTTIGNYSNLLECARKYVRTIFDGQDGCYFNILQAFIDEATTPFTLQYATNTLQLYAKKRLDYLATQSIPVDYREWTEIFNILKNNSVMNAAAQTTFDIKLNDATFREFNFRNLHILINKYGTAQQKELMNYYKIERRLSRELFDPNITENLSEEVLLGPVIRPRLIEYLHTQASLGESTTTVPDETTAFFTSVFPTLYGIAIKLGDAALTERYYALSVVMTLNCHSLAQLEGYLFMIKSQPQGLKSTLLARLSNAEEDHSFLKEGQVWNAKAQYLAESLDNKAVQQRWFTKSIVMLILNTKLNGGKEYEDEIDHTLAKINMDKLNLEHHSTISYARLEALCGEAGIQTLAIAIQDYFKTSFSSGVDIKVSNQLIHALLSADFLAAHPTCFQLNNIFEKISEIDTAIQANHFSEAEALIQRFLLTFEHDQSENALSYFTHFLHLSVIIKLRLLPQNEIENIQKLGHILQRLPALKNNRKEVDGLIEQILTAKLDIQTKFVNFQEKLLLYLNSSNTYSLLLDKADITLLALGLLPSEKNLLRTTIQQIIRKEKTLPPSLLLPMLEALDNILAHPLILNDTLQWQHMNMADILVIAQKEASNFDDNDRIKSLISQLPDIYFKDTMITAWIGLVKVLIQNDLYDIANTVLSFHHPHPLIRPSAQRHALEKMIDDNQEFNNITLVIASQSLESGSLLAESGFNLHALEDAFMSADLKHQDNFKCALENIFQKYQLNHDLTAPEQINMIAVDKLARIHQFSFTSAERALQMNRSEQAINLMTDILNIFDSPLIKATKKNTDGLLAKLEQCLVMIKLYGNERTELHAAKLMHLFYKQHPDFNELRQIASKYKLPLKLFSLIDPTNQMKDGFQRVLQKENKKSLSIYIQHILETIHTTIQSTPHFICSYKMLTEISIPTAQYGTAAQLTMLKKIIHSYSLTSPQEAAQLDFIVCQESQNAAMFDSLESQFPDAEKKQRINILKEIRDIFVVEKIITPEIFNAKKEFLLAYLTPNQQKELGLIAKELAPKQISFLKPMSLAANLWAKSDTTQLPQSILATLFISAFMQLSFNKVMTGPPENIYRKIHDIELFVQTIIGSLKKDNFTKAASDSARFKLTEDAKPFLSSISLPFQGK